MRRRMKGFSLMEVMFAMMVFAIATVSLMGFFASTARLNEQSRNLTQAMNDAKILMEGIRDTAQTSGLTGAAGVTGLFPAGENLGPDNDLTGLRDEEVTVTYADETADPLAVTVQVTWDEWGRQRAATLDTWVTRR